MADIGINIEASVTYRARLLLQWNSPKYDIADACAPDILLKKITNYLYLSF